MRRYLIVSLLLLFLFAGIAQKNYTIDVSKVKTDVLRGHLDLGERNIKGDSIGVNSFYLERNGKPFIPVIGEFHYSRFPSQYWDEEIKKMKAGGISVIATYVFWNLHEFKEGVFNWKGDLNLRCFVELCKSNQMEVLVRIGPFAHGEMRNGGLPDWLYGRPIEVRTNDPSYLSYVNRLYKEIAAQLNGLNFKDGGPILGYQIENEYQHSAAPWAFGYMDAPRERTVGKRDNKIIQDGVGINLEGNEFEKAGSDHMKTLKLMAQKAGLLAPIYTATGWGRATIVEKGSIPVMAGYAFPFWSAANSPSPFYLYKNIQQKPDYSPVSYDVNLYPSMAAELGTGMAVTYSRRPRVPGESFLPLMVRTVGSGTNGLGYYMYHGGTTPSVGNFFMSEEWGLNNKSYDYQAPIGEFGQISSGFKGLKIINYLLRDFGSDLAPLYPVVPETNDAIKPEDNSTLRYAVRSNGEKGYVFMHNFQDHLEMKDLKELQIEVQTKSGKIKFPSSGTFNLKAGNSAIFPFHVRYGTVDIQQATLQPFCSFENKGRKYFILLSVDGIQPEIIFKGNQKIRGAKSNVMDGNTRVVFPENTLAEISVKGQYFLILPFNQALNAYVAGEKDKNKNLFLSNTLILENDEGLELLSATDAAYLHVYPSVEKLLIPGVKLLKQESFIKNGCSWKLEMPKVNSKLNLVRADDRHFVLDAPDMDWNIVNDVFVTFHYKGDRAVCMMNGELQTDNLYNASPWIVGLKRYGEMLKKSKMYFYFVPMGQDAPFKSYIDEKEWPDFKGRREFLDIQEPILTPEYKLPFQIVN